MVNLSTITLIINSRTATDKFEHELKFKFDFDFRFEFELIGVMQLAELPNGRRVEEEVVAGKGSKMAEAMARQL